MPVTVLNSSLDRRAALVPARLVHSEPETRHERARREADRAVECEIGECCSQSLASGDAVSPAIEASDSNSIGFAAHTSCRLGPWRLVLVVVEIVVEIEIVLGL